MLFRSIAPARHRIATCNRDCQGPAGNRQSAGASYGNSFTLPLPATRSEVLGGISPPAHLIRCIGIQNNPPKSQICHAFCCHWKSTSSAQQSAPTAGSQGKANHTPNGLLWQEKPLPLAKCPGIAPTRPTVVRLRGPLPDWKRPAAEWPSKASQINPLAGVELQIPACICCGCILSRIEY